MTHIHQILEGKLYVIVGFLMITMLCKVRSLNRFPNSDSACFLLLGSIVLSVLITVGLFLYNPGVIWSPC